MGVNFRATALPDLAVRDVASETALVAALADLAARPGATPRTIRVTDPIFLSAPIFLSTAHYGLVLCGAGLTTGLFMASGVSGPALQTSGSQPIALRVENMTIAGVSLTSDRSAVPEGVTFRGVYFSDDVSFSYVQNLTIDDCDIESTSTATFDHGQDMSISNSRWRAVSTHSNGLGLALTGNRNLGATTFTGSCLAAVVGNVLTGAFNSSAGGGFSTFTGNAQNGNTVTLNASDVSAGNRT